MGPLVYLTLCSMRNRFRVRLRRLKEPRYLIGSIAGIAYFYFLFWRPRSSASGRVGRAGGLLAAMGRARPGIQLGGAGLLFVVAALAWIWPSRRRPALAFSKADVQFLFPAPFTRRQLIRYRVLRSQLGAFIGSAFMTLFLRPTSVANAWMFFLGIALIMAIVNLHLTGVSLSRESLGTHGVSGLARQWLPLGIVGGALVVLIGTVGMHWSDLAAMDTNSGVLQEVGRLASTGAASVVLWPFQAMARLPLSETPADFARALPAVLTILLLNYAWVLRSDAAFEEASAELAEKVARIRKGPQPTAPKSASPATPFTLSLAGPAETAILWKNLILVGRYVSLKTLLRFLPPILVIFGIGFSRGSGRGGIGALLAGVSVVVFVVSVIMGPQMARNDLRQDLANLSLLRMWPVRGATLVRGEILAPAAILIGIAWLCGMAGLMVGARLDIAPSYVLAAMLLSPGIILVQLLAQNAIAVMWPSWVVVGPRQSRGIDVMGQRLIMMVGLLVVLFVAVLPAAIAAGIVLLALYWTTNTVYILLPAAIAAVVLLGEAFIGSEAVGKILERTDVGQIDATES